MNLPTILCPPINQLWNKTSCNNNQGMKKQILAWIRFSSMYWYDPTRRFMTYRTQKRPEFFAKEISRIVAVQVLSERRKLFSQTSTTIISPAEVQNTMNIYEGWIFFFFISYSYRTQLKPERSSSWSWFLCRYILWQFLIFLLYSAKLRGFFFFFFSLVIWIFNFRG